MKLLRASTVLTGRPNEVVDDGEVLVDGTTIKGVGPRGSCQLDEGVEILDLVDCTVMPGLIDAHVHLGFDRTVDPRTRLSKSATLTSSFECRRTHASFSRQGSRPHLVVATRPITPSGGHCWYMGGEADTSDSIRLVARENLRAGADCLKNTDSGFGVDGRDNRMDDYAGGLDVFAAAGWDNGAIIEAATILAARAIGIGDVTGSLDEGKRADILAAWGNPLKDLHEAMGHPVPS